MSCLPSIAEYVIFGSGRPVLILPGAPNVTRPIRLDTIGIAWDSAALRREL